MVQTEPPQFPWSNSSPTKGNLAIGNLRESLKGLLTDAQGIHVETLLAAAGSIAGFSAQHAFWIDNSLSPTAVPETGISSKLVVVRLKSGERLFFGDSINGYLVGGAGPAEKLFLWAFVQGALVQLGLAPNLNPDVRKMFSRVSTVLGTEAFGVPDVPTNHRPKTSAIHLIKLLWPHVKAIMSLSPPPVCGRFRRRYKRERLGLRIIHSGESGDVIHTRSCPTSRGSHIGDGIRDSHLKT